MEKDCTVCKGEKYIHEDIKVIGMDGEYEYDFLETDCPKCILK